VTRGEARLLRVAPPRMFNNGGVVFGVLLMLSSVVVGCLSVEWMCAAIQNLYAEVVCYCVRYLDLVVVCVCVS